MKKIIFFAVLVALSMSMNFASASVIPSEGPVTLAEVEERFDNMFMVGDKIFSDFHIIASGKDGALTIDKSDIQVQGFVLDDLNISLQFVLNGFSAAAGQSADLFLTFAVEIKPEYQDYYIKDVGMRLNGASATGTGLVIANEQVTDGPSIDLNSNILANLDVSRQDNQNLDQLTDEAIFDPLKKIYITKDIQVNGGTAGAASLSGFVQSFSQIPEPMTLTLLGLGGLGLMTRRRQG